MHSPGARFGPYEVVGPLGAGGMGEVYRALDARLGREVALKVLPAGASADPQRLRRFETEARAAGALNHPNVLGILDLGTDDGHPYVVSELLEGETLRNRLRVSAFPVKKAIDLAIQIAQGLAAAHDKGIVHRDLKPENLFLTKDGRIKILDFGLAKLRTAERDETAPGPDDGAQTDSGTVLGTVGYMAPEQVRGLLADPRSDIFALGAVLYEMVSGRRAFRRDTPAETMTAILKDDPPDLRPVAPGAPPALERILRRCLEKSPDERFQSARDVAYALETVATTPDSVVPPTVAAARGDGAKVASGLGRGGWSALAAVLVTGAVIGALVVVTASGRAGGDLASYRFTPIATEAVYEGSPAWSPDGGTLAFIRDVSGILQVFTRGVGESLASQITQAPRDCREPFWSPDGTRVFYISQAGGEESLWSVSAAGGTPQTIVRNVRTATISRDGRILAFLREDGPQGASFQSLWISSPPGAEPRRYAEAPLADRHPSTGYLRFSPDGARIALWMVQGWDAKPGVAGTTEFWLVPMPGGAPRAVPALSGAHVPYPFDWMPDGRHIVFGTDRMARTPGLHLWMADVETGGTGPVTATNGSETYPAVSPDGARIAFTSQGENYHLIEIPLAPNASFQAEPTASGMETDPAWSPLGGQYAFVSDRSGRPEIRLRSRDGAFERPLVTSDSFKDARGTSMFSSLSFSPDGRRLAYQQATAGAVFGVWVSTVAGGPPVAVPSVPDSSYQDFPTWSPDGVWIAFSYMAKGKWGLAKVRAGGTEAPVVIKEGIVYPSGPRWSPRGDWITCDTPEGFTLVSPDGRTGRLLSEETWLAHGFSKDGATVYAVRQTENLHMQLTSFDVATGRETVVTEDLGLTPPTSSPLRGFSLAPDGRSFLTSIVELRGDIWLLEGFPRRLGLIDRLRAQITGAPGR